MASSSTTSFLINSRVLSELVEDGLLIDIRVTGTTKLEWNRVLEFLHTSDLTDRTNQTIEDQEHLDVSRVFEDASEESLINLSLKLHGPIILTCNFYCEDEIEFSIDPRQLSLPTDIDRVLNLMRQLGNLLNKPVGLAPEGKSDTNLILYQPALGEFLCDE
ncbi:hypothetical protein [Roseibium sp. RKSG952]|uniref:hypothetical protein n=1 Tax=Roseibium sp. RKSG952 TaxID=2529384 RepID=UPI0012BC6C7D|nr:hypothetical protein [Roseibium sp. RKSG952]MTI01788.1 hypothetical protein [Roseibium sp. RKSG952]